MIENMNPGVQLPEVDQHWLEIWIDQPSTQAEMHWIRLEMIDLMWRECRILPRYTQAYKDWHQIAGKWYIKACTLMENNAEGK
jgi:hypothetical protein